MSRESVHGMSATEQYDVVIIGSGAGGGTMAHALAPTGARILLVERGDFVPQEEANWDPAAVWKDLRYRATERWIDSDGHEFQPYMHYGVGGNSKYWGSVLYRLRREDFLQLQHADGISPAWPIDYETLAPYYDVAERLYSVHGQSGIDPTEPPRSPYPHAPVPHAPRIAELVDALRARGLHPAPLPLGLRDPGEPGGCMLCDTCNSFPCRVLAKSEADVCCVRPALTHPNVTLATRTLARRLHTNASGERVESVELEHDGAVRRVKAPVIVVSAGAVQSAALLLRSASDRHPRGLANSSDMVGRRYMAHLVTMLQGFDPRRVNDTVFQKTVAINDFYFGAPNAPYPLGHIQSQGRTHGVMAQTVVPSVPLWAYNAWVARGVDWLVMSEDLPRFDNRVTLEPDGRIRLTYRPNNLGPHQALVRRWSRLLKELGFWVVMKHGSAGRAGLLPGPAHHAKNTTHQCGTLCFGTDPKTSVLDSFCRSHDVENLFVVDASFFPSSAAVNPALTIIAQALRVAEHIKTSVLPRA